jgi:crotonobetainyl-CoA:carnitine CoA-transferase CaiB-like acyl-CoA transferase
MSYALEGIKVIEVAQVAAVPMAGRHLADFGAEVIHIEPPATGDAWRTWQPGSNLVGTLDGSVSYFNYNWENYGRNKKSVALDISKTSGREVLEKLISEADVFLTNLRLFERIKFGVTYESLHKAYPRLIYGSLTGYGKKGSEKDNPAYDTISYWARAGMGHLFSIPDVAPFVGGAAIGDNVTGLGLAFGIMLALYVREKNGLGQEVDLSLLHTGIYQLTYFISGTLSTGRDVKDWGSLPREETLNPLILPYETADKRWLLLAMPQSDRYWPKFCVVLQRGDLTTDPRFASFELRSANHKVLFHIIEEIIRNKPLSHWKERMTGIIPFSPYQNFVELINDPQVIANDMLVFFEHPVHGRIRVIDNPVRLSDTPASIRNVAPEIGQDTEATLLQHGYTWEQLTRLKQDNIIL